MAFKRDFAHARWGLRNSVVAVLTPRSKAGLRFVQPKVNL